MSFHNLSHLINEIVEQHRQLDSIKTSIEALKSSPSENFILGILPTLIGAITGGLITILVFYLNIKSDEKKKIASDLKEKREKNINIYGQLKGLFYGYSNQLLDFHQNGLNMTYWQIREKKIEISEDAISLAYTNKIKFHDLSMVSKDRLIEAKIKILVQIGEFEFINDDTKLIDAFEKIEKEYVKFLIPEDFEFHSEITGLETRRDIIQELINTHVVEKIQIPYNDMLKIIKPIST